MKPSLKVLIVGAGGVASYMAPALNNSFNLSGFLMDADVLEKHNLDRQIFSPSDIGKSKAEALIAHHRLDGIEPIVEFIDDSFLFRHREKMEGIELIICLVDNHPARRECLMLAQEKRIPIAICANEYSTSQAMYWHPEFGNPAHPITRYPEMRTDNSGSPVRCQGEALESTPQLAIANQVSASLGNYLIWLWHGDNCYEPEKLQEGFEPIEYQSTFSKFESITLNDL